MLESHYQSMQRALFMNLHGWFDDFFGTFVIEYNCCFNSMNAFSWVLRTIFFHLNINQVIWSLINRVIQHVILFDT